MKILFVAPRYHTNQIPIVQGLIAKGHTVHFWSSYKGKTENYDAVSPELLRPSWVSRLAIFIVRRHSSADFEYIHRRWFFPSFWQLLRSLRALKPDVVVCRGENITTAMTTFICRLFGSAKLVLYVQKPVLNLKRKSNWLRRIFLPGVMMSPVLVKNPRAVPAPATEKAFLEFQSFIPLVYEAKPESLGRSYFKDDKLNVLSVGKFRSYKNLSLLVEAITRLQPEHAQRIAVTIVGQMESQSEQVYFSRLQAQIASANLGAVITLKMNVPYTEIDTLYLSNDVFVLTSIREAASVSVVEAMASGLVVISTDENGTASYVEPGVSGYWFETGNAAALAGVLTNLIMAENTAVSAMGRAAQNRARKNFNFEVYYMRLMNLLRSGG